MIERQLEPEYMDSHDEARAYDAMDHGTVNATFAEDLLATGDTDGMVLDVGTGTALIPIEICNRHPSLRIVAADAATTMLDLGRMNVAAAGHEQRIRLCQVDAKSLPFNDGEFDCVISNSLMHHLPDPAVAARELVRVLKPGGRVFVRDLLRPASPMQLEALVQLHASHETPGNQQLLRQSLHAALTLEEIVDIIVPLGFSSDGVGVTSDRHWTWSAVKS
jgi:ubiquinone/menaquinone biosynthesis C-methylase UbiE